jgi:single-strand DNA-binding protein
MINVVTLVGRVTSDIEVKQTTGGTEIASFTIAVSRNFKNANNEYESDFIRCKAFGKTASHLGQHSGKGKVLSLQGSIQTGSYQKEDGTKIYTTDVIVNNCDCFTGNPKQEQNFNQVTPQQFMGQESTITDDDLPF